MYLTETAVRVLQSHGILSHTHHTYLGCLAHGANPCRREVIERRARQRPLSALSRLVHERALEAFVVAFTTTTQDAERRRREGRGERERLPLGGHGNFVRNATEKAARARAAKAR